MIQKSIINSLKSEQFKVLVLLAITIWIAHFWHSDSFGLYEDDYNFWDLGLLHSIKRVFLNFSQGRPIGFSIVFISSYLAKKLGGLYIAYWIAFIIATLNSFLFYLLLKRLSDQNILALIGGLAFALFPADTTKAFLTHIHIYPGLTFLLLAFHAYFSNRKRLSYLFVVGSLLCYETIFPVFLAAPLLNIQRQSNSRIIKELIKNTLIMGIIFLCTIIIRKIVGESRTATTDITTAIQVMINQMLMGPFVSMKMFLVRPIDAFRALNGELLIFVLLCFIGLVYLLSQFKLDTSANALRFTTSVETKVFRLEIPQFFQEISKLAFVGFIMLVLAYPLTLTVPATAISGRSSRVHLAAVIGASILCACICSAILFIAGAYRKKRLATVVLAAFFALLVGFGLTVQQDYKLAWQYQRAFWTDVIGLCPDMTDGTVILVEDNSLRRVEQIAVHIVRSEAVISRLFNFPRDWQQKPKLYYLRTGWQDKIVSADNLWQLNYVTTTAPKTVFYADRSRYWTEVESSNVILLEAKDGKLTRRTESIIIDSQEFPLKDQSTSETPQLDPTYLYQYLIKSPDEESVNYLN